MADYRVVLMCDGTARTAAGCLPRATKQRLAHLALADRHEPSGGKKGRAVWFETASWATSCDEKLANKHRVWGSRPLEEPDSRSASGGDRAHGSRRRACNEQLRATDPRKRWSAR